MHTLNLIVRMVLVHEGKLLVSALDDGQRDLFYFMPGGHIRPGQDMLSSLKNDVKDKLGLEVAPVRLLYITENFFARGATKLHELGYFFLCSPVHQVSGDFVSSLTPRLEQFVSPELMDAETLVTSNFQPSPLKTILVKDMEEGFKHPRVRLIVTNDLPGDVMAQSGVWDV